MQNQVVIYVLTVLLASFFAWLAQKFAKDKKGKYKLNKPFWILSMLTLIFTMGFRTIGVGVDDLTYERIFETIRQIGPVQHFINTTMEPGYLFLNYIIGIFTDDFQVVLVVIAVIGIFFFYKAIEYERKNINLFLAVFIFSTILYFYYIGIMRLFLAASIVAYALRFVFEKKTMRYVILIIFAGMFHYSALFMLFLVYFSTENEKKPRSIKSIVLMVTIIMPVIIYVVSQVIFPNMGDRYSGNYTTMNKLSISLSQFDKLPIIIVALVLYKDLLKNNKNIKIYIVMYTLAITIGIYSTVLNIGRIQWYMNFAICIIFPSIVRSILNTKFKNFIVLLIPIILLYGTIYAYRIIYIEPTNEGLRNYSNVFFKE